MSQTDPAALASPRALESLRAQIDAVADKHLSHAPTEQAMYAMDSLVGDIRALWDAAPPSSGRCTCEGDPDALCPRCADIYMRGLKDGATPHSQGETPPTLTPAEREVLEGEYLRGATELVPKAEPSDWHPDATPAAWGIQWIGDGNEAVLQNNVLAHEEKIRATIRESSTPQFYRAVPLYLRPEALSRVKESGDSDWHGAANFLRGLPLAAGCAPDVHGELDALADRLSRLTVQPKAGAGDWRDSEAVKKLYDIVRLAATREDTDLLVDVWLPKLCDVVAEYVQSHARPSKGE